MFGLNTGKIFFLYFSSNNSTRDLKFSKLFVPSSSNSTFFNTLSPNLYSLLSNSKIKSLLILGLLYLQNNTSNVNQVKSSSENKSLATPPLYLHNVQIIFLASSPSANILSKI